MTWLTWRLHRSEALIGAVLFALLVGIMFLAMRSVDSAFDAVDARGCFENSDLPACNELMNEYYGRLSNWSMLTTLLHGIPIALATLLVIPTLQELERGTHRLAWTQSISRRRWVLWRIGFVLAITIATTAVWTLISSAWRTSMLPGESGTFIQNAFELSPAVLFGYGVFAVALGFAGTVVLRRMVPSIALLAAGFLAARIFTTFAWREQYRTPIREVVPAASDRGPYTAYADRWIFDESWLSRSGERLSWDAVNRACQTLFDAQNTEEAYRNCLVENGFQYLRVYQPLDRVGQFQLIEATIYLGMAAGLFAFSYLWLTRRPVGDR